METIKYRGYNIEVSYMEDAENPFENWDGLLPLISKYGRGYTSDYSKGDINTYLSEVLTDNQIILHQKRIYEITGEVIYEFETIDEKIALIREMIQELDGFNELAGICEIAKVPYLNTCVKGYSQGDYADLFICYTDKFGTETGLEMKDITKDRLKNASELYESWAFGDVYGFYIEDIDDACAGFYGSNHKKSGLLEMAKESIDSYIKSKRLQKIEKLKVLIKNNVPYFNRQLILNSI